MADEPIRIGGRHPAQLFIRQWIKHRNLDQRRVAGRMEIEEGTVSKLLSGKMELTLYYLMGFADALDTSVPQLFRDPLIPTRDELLKGYSDQELTTALRLIETSRAAASTPPADVLRSTNERRPEPEKKRAARG